MSELLTML